MGQAIFKLNESASKALTYGSLLATDHSWSGLTARVTVDTNTVGFGGVLVMAADGKWDDIDKDAATTTGMAVMALEAGTGANKLVLLQGMVRDDTWNWTPSTGQSNNLYAGDSGAIVASVAAYTTGDQVQVIGSIISADTIYFNPNMAIVEIA